MACALMHGACMGAELLLLCWQASKSCCAGCEAATQAAVSSLLGEEAKKRNLSILAAVAVAACCTEAFATL